VVLAGAVMTGCRSAAPPPPPPAPGVPLTLAEHRAATISNVRYDLAFTVPAAPEAPVTGHATITFTLKDASAPVVLDFDPETPQNLQNPQNPQNLQNGHLLIPRSRLSVGPNSIDVSFVAGNAPLNRNPDFMYTLFVPARAHLAFPCFDQPDLKARFTLTLTVPSDWKAVSNGPETGRTTTGGETTIHYAETKPIPTYLFAFAAGRFEVETAERNGRTFHMYHRENDRARVERNRDAAFDLVAASLAWLEDYTGIPFPFPKYDFVLIPSFQFGGMEHPGAIFFDQASVLLDASATESQILNRANLLAHETSHMWFGDLVTMKWFDDVWMKEVFANFLAAKIVNPSFPDVNHDLRFLVSNYPSAYSVDRTAGTHPIRQPLDNLNDAGSQYGPIVYQKAPIVMRQLERIVGADAFRDGLRAYLQQFAFGNATWLDLVRLLDARTPLDLAAWSHAWVEEGGRPAIAADVAVDASGRLERLAFVQSDPQPDRSLRWTQDVEVLIGTAAGTRTIPLQLAGERTEVPDAASLGTPLFILPAGGGLAYGDITLDPASRAYLLAHVETLADPVARGATWVTLWEALLDGRVAPMDFIEATLRAVPRETTEQNVQLAIGYLRGAFWTFITPAARQAVAPRLERMLRAGLDRARTSSLKATYFQAFRSVVTTDAGVAWLERVWRRDVKTPGLTLEEPDEAAMALDLALRGVPDAPAILDEQLARFRNPDRRARFAFVRSSVSASADVRAAFFRSLSDPANRRREPWAADGLAYLDHPLRRPESERYITPALEMLEEIQRTGDIFFPKNWTDATLGGHNSKAAADAVRAFLAARPDYPVRLRRIILQSADTLFRAAAQASP
jgi:aminopeptidase N